MRKTEFGTRLRSHSRVHENSHSSGPDDRSRSKGGRQELGAPSNPREGADIAQSQFSEEAREKRWLVCEYTVCEPSPYGSPTSWNSSLPSAQSPTTALSDL